MKGVLVRFARDLAAIRDIAQSASALDAAARAESLRVRVRRVLRRPLWAALTPGVATAAAAVAPSPTLLSHPHYRRLYETDRRYRQSFRFDWSTPLFSLPARETWLLYEYWGLFQTADALRALGFRATRADDFALRPRTGLTFALAKGTASRIEFALPNGDVRVSLTYNREFGRASDSPGWHSRSHTLRPDITIEREGDDDHRLLLLDPKFKTFATPGWELPDIHQMHAYRDAIRHGETRPVAASWLLYAGRHDAPNRPLIAYPRSTTAHPFGNGEVGALNLRPGDDGMALKKIIAAFLNAGSAGGDIIDVSRL